MPAAVELHPDFDAPTLRSLATRCADAKQSRRLLSIAAIYDGMSRGAAAKIGGMDRQVLRDHCPAGYAKHAREEGCCVSMSKGRTA